jgi:signal transduction histidine kinase/ligand-binding sensor domain-containing protein
MGRLLPVRLLMLGLVAAVLAFGERPADWIKQATRRTFTTRDGLPPGSIYALRQTRDGYVWIGGSGGLARFDGVRFVTFDRRNVPELGGLQVSRLVEDSYGTLWVGTSTAGLFRHKEGRFLKVPSPSQITALAPDSKGGLYIGTLKGLTYRSADGKLHDLGSTPGVPQDMILHLWASPAGVLWIGTNEKGVFRMEKGVAKPIPAGTGWEGRTFRIDSSDGGRTVYIATIRGLLVWHDATSRLEQMNRCALISIAAGPDGRVWGLQTSGNVMSVHEGETGYFDTFSRKVRLFYGDALRDRDGNIWFGHDYGLDFFSTGRFRHFGTPEGLADDQILSVTRRRGGGFFVGTEFGLHLLDSERHLQRILTEKDGLRDSAVFSIHEDPDGTLYVGSAAGLTEIRNGRYRVFDGKNFGAVFAIHRDPSGQLWLGTHLGGLLRWDENGSYQTFEKKQGLLDTQVHTMAHDAHGNLLVATRSGVNVLRNGSLLPLTQREARTGEQANSLLLDSRKGLWIGRNTGLHLYQPGGKPEIVRVKGIPDDDVSQLQEDDKGYLWMSTNGGVLRVPLADLYAAVKADRPVETAVLMTDADGLRRPGHMGLGQKAEGIVPASEIAFATRGGLVMLTPAATTSDASMPPARIEEMAIDGQLIRLDDKVRVPPGVKRIDFYYTGLGFAAADRFRFRYLLENFDRDWVDAGSRRSATYTNLSPGNYRFRVMVANRDGVWNASGAASFEFAVEPRFWQTAWFRLLAMLAVIGAVLLGFHLRDLKMREHFQIALAERTRLARDLHDTLLQGFAGISWQIQAIVSGIPPEQDRLKSELDRALRRIDYCLMEARHAVAGLREGPSEASGLETRLQKACEEIEQSSGVRIEFRIDGTRRSLPPLSDLNLFMVAREAISNAARHASATHIEVALEYTAREVIARVRDNGKGFRPKPSFEGHWGIQGMKERMASIGGRLVIQSAPGEGTLVLAITRTAEGEIAPGPNDSDGLRKMSSSA